MADFCHHSQDLRSSFFLNTAVGFLQSQSLNSAYLSFIATDFTFYKCDFNLCHDPQILTVKHFIQTNASLSGNRTGITHFFQCSYRSFYQIVRVGRTFTFSQYVVNTGTFQNSTHSTSGYQPGTGRSGLHINLRTAETSYLLMRNSSFQYRYFDQVLFSSFDPFRNSCSHLVCFS